jgi:hypothetical protein
MFDTSMYNEDTPAGYDNSVEEVQKEQQAAVQKQQKEAEIAQ